MSNALGTIVGMAFLWSSLTTSTAASFSSDFNAGLPSTAALYGAAQVAPGLGADKSGGIRLAGPDPDQEGSLLLKDLDDGRAIAAFNARFKVRVGGGSGADGFSFNFGSDLPEAPFSEEGAGLGLIVSFDTFDNANGEAPAIDVKVGGFTIASKKFNARTGDSFVDVIINVDADGTIDVIYGGIVVHSNLSGFIPSPGRFAFAARTHSVADQHILDDLNITTTVLNGPFVRLASPSGSSVPPNAAIDIRLEDYESAVDPGSVELKVNGLVVRPEVVKSAETTQITYAFPGLLPAGSFNAVELRYADDGLPPVVRTLRYDFLVGQYVTIPSNFAMAASQVDRDGPGFLVRTVQARADAAIPSSLARAEAQLAGTLIDPATGNPFANEAIPGSNPDGSHEERGVLNYDQNGSPSGGFLDGEQRIPGIPGKTGHSDNFAVEILTVLELPAGYHQLGVNSDEGFRVVVGATDPRDAFSLAVGQHDGVRQSSDTLFSVLAEASGFYSIRIVWFEGLGPSNLEFFSVRPDGKRILINDRANAQAVRAYRSKASGAASPPYILSVVPAPGATGVSLAPEIAIVLADSKSSVATGTVQLRLNGENLAPTIVKNGSLTEIRHQVRAPLRNLSTNRVILTFSDTSNPAVITTRQWDFVTARVIRPASQWDFDGGGLAATIGQPLEFGDGPGAAVAAQTQFGTTDSFGIPNISGKPAGVMKFTRGESVAVAQSGFLLRHCIQPGNSGSRVNQWTLLMDVFFPDPQDSSFSSLIQLDDPASDADLFVRWNDIAGEGTGGIGTLGQYRGNGNVSLKLGQWHRLAFAVDLTSATPLISKFIDGIKFEDQQLAPPQIDGRFSLGATARLFCDNDNELNTFYVNSIQFLDGKLTDDEITALGKASSEGIPIKVAPEAVSDIPRLSVVRAESQLILSWTASCFDFTLESSETLDRLSWRPVTGVSGNSATVPVEAKVRFYRLRR